MGKLQELLALTDEDLYSIYNDGEPEQASQGVRDSYKAHNNALETYIVEVSENAFACGFRYALSVMKGGEI